MSEPTVRVEDRHPPETKEFYVDDWLYVGLIPLRAGEVAAQHVHDLDHPTLIVSGTVQAWADGKDLGDFIAPTYVTIRAGIRHSFLAKSDALICCCHNLRGEGYPAVSGE